MTVVLYASSGVNELVRYLLYSKLALSLQGNLSFSLSPIAVEGLLTSRAR
jgi:hypothetical protein